jgi:hypothetical protein
MVTLCKACSTSRCYIFLYTKTTYRRGGCCSCVVSSFSLELVHGSAMRFVASLQLLFAPKLYLLHSDFKHRIAAFNLSLVTNFSFPALFSLVLMDRAISCCSRICLCDVSKVPNA